MHSYLCPPKVDLRAFSVTQGVIPLQLQYEGLVMKKKKKGGGGGTDQM
jgi:hypothetical protein